MAEKEYVHVCRSSFRSIHCLKHTLSVSKRHENKKVAFNEEYLSQNQLNEADLFIYFNLMMMIFVVSSILAVVMLIIYMLIQNMHKIKGGGDGFWIFSVFCELNKDWTILKTIQLNITFIFICFRRFFDKRYFIFDTFLD